MNLKIEEIRSEMAKEVLKIDHNYSTLNTKVYIIAEAMMKVVGLYNSLLPKVD